MQRLVQMILAAASLCACMSVTDDVKTLTGSTASFRPATCTAGGAGTTSIGPSGTSSTSTGGASSIGTAGSPHSVDSGAYGVTTLAGSSSLASPESSGGSAPAHCFGDLTVAAEIVNPSTPLVLARLGDSRTVNLTNAILQEYSPGPRWVGLGFSWSDYPQPWKSVIVYDQAPLTAKSTPFGDLGTLTPQSLHLHTLATGTSGANDQSCQYFYTTYTPGRFALPQLVDRTLRLKLLLLEGPHGVTSEDLQLVVDYLGSTYRGEFFSTYAATVGVKVVYLDIPNTHDWVRYGTLYPKLVHRWNTATVGGQQVVILGAAWVPVDAGLCEVNCGVGSRQTASFVEETIFSGSLWSSYFVGLGSNVGLWIDLGTNGSGDLSTAQADAANKILIAKRFRAQFPSGPIMFTTAFPGGTEAEPPGTSRGWREGAILATASISHSMVVDTYNAMPPAEQAIALSYYSGGDYVHYTLAGNRALAAKTAEILRNAASAAEL